MPNWAVVLIGVSSLILGVAITEIGRWLERRERYKVLSFEKRLEAHQQALTWCLKIGWLTESAYSAEAKKVELEEVEEFTNGIGAKYLPELKRKLEPFKRQ